MATGCGSQVVGRRLWVAGCGLLNQVTSMTEVSNTIWHNIICFSVGICQTVAIHMICNACDICDQNRTRTCGGSTTCPFVMLQFWLIIQLALLTRHDTKMTKSSGEQFKTGISHVGCHICYPSHTFATVQIWQILKKKIYIMSYNIGHLCYICYSVKQPMTCDPWPATHNPLPYRALLIDKIAII
jgi:hypothetical protein